MTTDDVTHLRALLAEQTAEASDAIARAQRMEADYRAALAANAELRAALEHYAARAYTSRRDTDEQIQHVAAEALSRPDLGAGKVLVERAAFQRVRDELHEWMRGDPDFEEVLADLDALLKKGGG